MKAKLILFCILMMTLLSISVWAGTWNNPSSGATIGTGLQTLNLTCTPTNVLNVTFSGHGISTDQVVANTSGGQQTFTLATYDPKSSDVGNSVQLTGKCSNATGLYIENNTVTFNMWDYESDEADDIAIDTIGEAGVQFKVWIPIIVLILALSFGVKVWNGVRRKK